MHLVWNACFWSEEIVFSRVYKPWCMTQEVETSDCLRAGWREWGGRWHPAWPGRGQPPAWSRSWSRTSSRSDTWGCRCETWSNPAFSETWTRPSDTWSYLQNVQFGSGFTLSKSIYLRIVYSDKLPCFSGWWLVFVMADSCKWRGSDWLW